MPRDPRPYITVAVGIPEHPKVEALSDKAFRLLIETWCYCSRNDTDGHVADAAWKRRGTARARQELVDAGLVLPSSTGVWMHDYLEHQTSAADRAERSEKRARAGKLGGLARSRSLASATAGAKQVPSTVLSKTQAEVEVEAEVEEPPPSGAPPDAAPQTPAKATTARGTRIPDDFAVTPEMQAWARTNAPSTGLTDHDAFVDYWRSIPGQKGRKTDWVATWRNWMRRASTDKTPTNVRHLRPGQVQR